MGTLDRMDHDRHETIDRSARRLVGEPAPGEGERTVGQLVADVSHDVSAIVRNEIQLAKSEVTAGLKIGGKGAGLLGAAAFIGLLGLIFLFHTIAQVIAIWLPVWAGYLITTALLFVVAGVLGLVGYKTVTKAKPVPKKAIRNAQETVEAIKPGR
ncbi:phage holin family protein [Janibacter melonis]